MLLVGVGWGYVLEQLSPDSAQFASENFEAFEPLTELVAQLERHGRKADLEKRGLCLRSALSDVGLPRDRPWRILVLPAYSRLFPGLGERVESALSRSVDASTTRHFLRTWLRNALIRLHENERLEFLAEPSGARSGPPVLYCGAGPLLLEELASVDLRGVFVIAADSALAPLLAAGVPVQLTLSVDSGPGTLYHLRAARRGSKSAELPVPVLSWLAGAPWLDQFFTRRILYRSTFPIDQLLGTGPLSGLPERDNPTRNLLGLALHTAHSLGARTLFLAGADFRSHQGQSHVRGTGYTLFAQERLERLQSIESYRTPVYGSEPGPTGRIALAGARALASRLELELLPCSEMTRAETSDQAGLPTITLDSRPLRRYLYQHREQLSSRSLRDMGAATDERSVTKLQHLIERLR